MTAPYNPFVNRFAIFVVCWTVLLLVAGALVTSNEAALSVPDWPKSFGTWMPPMVGGVRYEHSHRLIAGALGLLSIALAVLIWVKEKRRWLRWFAVIAVAGVVVQALLGGQVVIQLLHYWLPVLHACFAQIVFAALISIAVFTSRWWAEDREQFADRGSPAIHTLVMLNAAVIFCQILLGAANRHRDISAKPHVVGAFVVLGVVTWTAVVLRKRFAASRELSKARVLLHGIFGLQFVLGFGALWSRITTAEAPQPMPVMVALTVVHTVVGALLFATSILIVLICYRLVPRGKEMAVTTERQAAV